MKRSTANALLVLAGLSLASMSALADNDYSATPVFGGDGGGSFLAYCPKHTYLIGVAGRTGDWIDAIQPICAAWNSPAQAFDPPIYGSTAGGSGGGPTTLMCPAGMVIRGWEIARIADGNSWLVRYVRPQCETVSPEQPPSAQIPGRFGGSIAMDPADLMGYKCPEGQFANGIYGASGAYVDNAGLKCEAQPAILGRPVPSPSSVKSLGRVPVEPGPARPARSICEAARDARARNSPAAPNLEAQCRAVGERPAASTTAVSAVDSRTAGVEPAPPPGRRGATYNSPMIVAANGQTVMLDYCAEYGSSCGMPAADAFCRQKGHSGASRFQISEDIGHTAIISSGAVCDQPSCDGFTKIECLPDRE